MADDKPQPNKPPRVGASHRPPGRQIKGPFVVKCEPGKYAWCRCGLSDRYPYCDGSHREQAPEVLPIKVIIDEERTVVWCACGRSKNPPYCDGSHGDL